MFTLETNRNLVDWLENKKVGKVGNQKKCTSTIKKTGMVSKTKTKGRWRCRGRSPLGVEQAHEALVSGVGGGLARKKLEGGR